jgi:hypothetical protein
MILGANPNLDGLDQIIVVSANIAGAAFAAVCFGVASVKVERYRALNVVSALLALAYVIGYFILLWTDVEQASWSSALRWLGLLAWPLIWAVPPLRLIRRTPVFLALEQAVSGDDD